MSAPTHSPGSEVRVDRTSVFLRIAMVLAVASASFYAWRLFGAVVPLPPDGEVSGRRIQALTTESLLALGIAVIPAMIVGFYILRPARSYPSKSALAVAFAFGAGAPALAGETVRTSPSVMNDWVYFLLGEEFWKAALLIAAAVFAPVLINSPVKGFVLGWLSGMGFSFLENAQYNLNFFIDQIVTGDESPLPFFVRGVAGVLAGHYLYTAVVGAFIALGLQRGGRWGIAGGSAVGLLAGLVLHTMKNNIPVAGVPINLAVMVFLLRWVHGQSKVGSS